MKTTAGTIDRPRNMLLSLSAAVFIGFHILCGQLFVPLPVAANEGSVLVRITKEEAPGSGKDLDSVRPLNERTVLARERYQGGPFRVLSRKEKIERYPCAGCHGGAKVTARKGLELTHGTITLKHGQIGSLACIDCHSQKDRNVVEDKKGNAIDFDHSYLLCGQCHFRQKSDWLGGAHGKRARYWAGERVIFNCTTCHNPHSPRFARRFPVTYSPANK